MGSLFSSSSIAMNAMPWELTIPKRYKTWISIQKRWINGKILIIINGYLEEKRRINGKILSH